jgi:hypothetical protein
MADHYDDLVQLRSQGELAVWEPIGREVRTGSWAQQAEPTLDRIALALAENRRDDAAALVRHLVVEAQEIHDLYTEWTETLSRVLERDGIAAELDDDPEWVALQAGVGELAARCEAGRATERDVEALADRWRESHDRRLDRVAHLLDMAVERLGEERLGEVWAELQAAGIASYERYDVRLNPWERSRALLLQIAIEGMHGHLGGPERRGAVEVLEHGDRVELRFSPCGSGGILRAREAFGVTTARHDFAWNELGVCHYCVHCCVLQQLTPIDRLGYPARVIDPPLRPGDSCSWSVYHDPSLVPEQAYRRVGREKPASDDGGPHA